MVQTETAKKSKNPLTVDCRRILAFFCGLGWGSWRGLVASIRGLVASDNMLVHSGHDLEKRPPPKGRTLIFYYWPIALLSKLSRRSFFLALYSSIKLCAYDLSKPFAVKSFCTALMTPLKTASVCASRPLAAPTYLL